MLDEVPPGAVNEVIVVDGGSTDGTPEIAESAGARVIRDARRGYGRACASGLDATQGDLVVFMDADGADIPGKIPCLLEPLINGHADLVLGSRLAGVMLPGAMPWHQQAGNWFAARLISLLYRLPLTDLSPFRAVRRDALQALGMVEMTFGYPTEMIVRAIRAGWRIVEIPVGYRPRTAGKSKISGTMRGTFLATWYIIKVILRYRFG